jgi:hypothetical protein
MDVLRRFDPHAFLQNEPTLAGLAGLAGVPLQNENEKNEPNPLSDEIEKSGPTPAKAAKLAKVDEASPRLWAAACAGLDPVRPPGDVPRRRWEAFLADCNIFLGLGWAEKAVSLGWGAYDLFGCDRTRPFARIDCAGLLWLLNGARLAALTEDTATVETRTGARHTYRRKPNEFGRTLVWELA